MKRKAAALMLCLCMLLSSMGQVFAYDAEPKSEVHSAETAVEMKQAKAEAAEDDDVKIIYSENDIDFVWVDEQYVQTNDADQAVGAAVYLYYNEELEEYTIPSTVKDEDGKEWNVVAVDEYAVSYVSMLKRVSIPSGVKQIGIEAFSGCENLTEISVDKENTNYSSEAGVLYDKDKIALECYPGGKSGAFEIVSSVTEIADGACCGCFKLTDVVIPEHVKTLGVEAFADCTELRSITVPASVSKIDDYAFLWCEQLKKIRFKGSLPMLGEVIFDGISEDAVAYYPLDWARVPGAEECGSEITWIPDVPKLSSLKAASAGYNSAKISWSAVKGADGYIVYRKFGDSWKSIKTVGSTATSYTDSGLTCGTTYTYTVRAYKTVNGKPVKGGYDSKGVSAKPLLATVKLGSASVSGSSIKVTWSKVSGANGYVVYRKAPGGSWKSIKTVGSATVSYTDKPGAGNYVYTVRAYRTVSGKQIKGGYDSKGVSARIAPAAPVLKSISGSAGSIKVTWGQVSRADGYRIYRKNKGDSKWVGLTNLSGGSTVSYKDTDAAGGAAYSYTVRAYIKDADVTTWSGYDKTGISVTVPAQPELLSAKSSVSGSTLSATVKWSKVSGAAGYRIYRKTDTTNWKQIKAISGNSTLYYKDTGLTCGTEYAYTVRAYTKAGTNYILSTYDKTGLRAFAPAQVKLISAAAEQKENSPITVKWEAAEKAEGYRIYRKTSGGKWAQIGNVDGDTLSFADKNAQSCVAYWYTVRAFDNVNGTNVYGPYDAKGVSAVSCYLAAPELMLIADRENSSQTTADLYLMWNKIENADGYIVYVQNADGKWQSLGKITSAEAEADEDICGILLAEKFDFSGPEEIFTVRAYKVIDGKEVRSAYDKDGVSTVQDIINTGEMEESSEYTAAVQAAE